MYNVLRLYQRNLSYFDITLPKEGIPITWSDIGNIHLCGCGMSAVSQFLSKYMLV